MPHINTSIVSRYLATKYYAHFVAPLPNSQQINHSSSNHSYTKSRPKHTHHHYAPSVTLTHMTHIISSSAPTYAPYSLLIPGFVDRTHRSDCTAGQIDGESGWWATSRKIGLPPPTSKGHVVMFTDSSDKYDIQIKHNNTI